MEVLLPAASHAYQGLSKFHLSRSPYFSRLDAKAHVDFKNYHVKLAELALRTLLLLKLPRCIYDYDR